MRLLFSGPTTDFSARQLAMGFGEAADIEVEMRAIWAWADEGPYRRHWAVDPFELVTAARTPGNELRLGWAAPEWIAAQLDTTWPLGRWFQEPGPNEEFVYVPSLDSGDAVISLARAALNKRADDVSALLSVVTSIAIHDNWDSADEAALKRVNCLLLKVHSEIPVREIDTRATAYGLDEQVSDDLIALAAAEMLLHLRHGSTFRLCEHCFAPFVTSGRVDERYCRRPAPDAPSVTSRTCAYVGPRISYEQRLTPRRTSYRRELQRLTQLVNRHGLDRQLLVVWRSRAGDVLADDSIADDDIRAHLSALAAELGIRWRGMGIDPGALGAP